MQLLGKAFKMSRTTVFGWTGIGLLGVIYLLPAAGQEQTPPISPPVSEQQPAITASPQRAAAPIHPQRAVLNRYCVSCHNEKSKTAGLMLDRMDIENVVTSAPVWEKVVRKLRTDAMPPVGMARPDKTTNTALAEYLETELDRAAAAKPNPGRPAIHRLNRTEYTNAIRDLLAIDTDAIDIPSMLPADDSSYGFDNIGDALTVSPTLMEAYLSASRKISRLAVGDPAVRPVVETYTIPKYVMQDQRMSEDLPFWSRGGIAIRHHFPLEGEYTFTVRMQRNAGRAGGLDIIFGRNDLHQIDVRLDGKRIKLFTVGGDAGLKTQAEEDERDAGLEVRVPVQAGTHVVGVTFLNQSTEPEGIFEAPVTDYSNAISTGPDAEPAIGRIVVAGPYNGKGVGETPSRRKIFVCRPDGKSDELPCARQILSTIARRAYRGSVAPQDLESLLNIFKTSRDSFPGKEGFERGIQTALQRILVDPEFLFRIERDPANLPSGRAYPLSNLELASRLSFFLWSSIPDDQLLEVAERGQLKDPAMLERQVRRMLADSRSRALVENFAGQWLYLRNVEAVWPNPEIFPSFVANLREDFRQETELFFESMLQEDRSVVDLLRADYTFLNERLAQHYGVPNIHGGHFRRVTMTDENRKGLLGHGSILMVTSYATRTAPTIRGKWLLENILGAPPPPPPPDVPSLDEKKTNNGRPLTMRELMEEHRVNPACASCHRIMDPLGFALENFDATGKWRTTEGNSPIDASGVLPDGTKFQGPAELRKILLGRPEQLVHTVTQKLLTYALGRGVEYYDAPAIRKIEHEAEPADYRWSSLIIGIVNSMPFQMRSSS
jgi:hypothetical protein